MHQITNGAVLQKRSSIDDNVILAQALARSETHAWREMERRHYPSVLRICRFMLKNQRNALEAANDILFKAWRKIGKYDARRSSIATWIAQIATCFCKDYLRAQERREKDLSLEKAMAENSTDPRFAVSCEADMFLEECGSVPLEQQAKAMIIAGILRKLAVQERTIINLHTMGHTFSEIAEILSLREDTARLTCWRVINKIKALWERTVIGGAA